MDHAPEIELAAARPHPAAAGQVIAHAGGEPLAEVLDLRELLRIGDVPEIGRRYGLTTTPFFITAAIRLVLRMSASGSASRSTRSAAFPTAMVPV